MVAAVPLIGFVGLTVFNSVENSPSLIYFEEETAIPLTGLLELPVVN